jgi:hypothetical protein
MGTPHSEWRVCPAILQVSNQSVVESILRGSSGRDEVALATLAGSIVYERRQKKSRYWRTGLLSVAGGTEPFSCATVRA